MAEEPVFSDEPFMSREEKKRVLKAWIRFLKNGCAKTQFTEALYHHLSQHCSFIAHFDRQGFYDFYFGRINASLFRFFDQFDPQLAGVSAEYGGVHWLSPHNTGADLNHAMRGVAGAYLQALRHEFAEVRRQRDIGDASRTLARYGFTIVPATTVPEAIRGQSETPGSPPVRSIQPQLFTE